MRCRPPIQLIGWLHVGPDRAIWFAERGGNNIGRITLQGRVTEYPIPTVSGCEGEASSVPQGITTGRDGNLWFTEECGNKIGRITLDGVITEYAVPTPDSGLLGITAGPDGALWFVENERGENRAHHAGRTGHRVSAVARDAPAAHHRRRRPGVVVLRARCEQDRPPHDGWHVHGVRRAGRTGGHHGRAGQGAVVCGGFTGNSIGRMNLAGQVTHSYAIPTAQSGALQITVGPDRALWFTEGFPPDGSRNALGRVQPFKGTALGQASFNTGAASHTARSRTSG